MIRVVKPLHKPLVHKAQIIHVNCETHRYKVKNVDAHIVEATERLRELSMKLGLKPFTTPEVAVGGDWSKEGCEARSPKVVSNIVPSG